MRRLQTRFGTGVGLAAVSVLLIGTLAPATAGAAPGRPHHAPQRPTDLSVGDRVRPLDVEGPPQFGWLAQDPDGNEIQTAYQIRVFRDGLGSAIWDSGKVASSDQSYVPYAGPALADGA